MFEFFKRKEQLTSDRAAEKLSGNEAVAEAVSELERLTFGGGRFLDDQKLRTQAAVELLAVVKSAGVELLPEGPAAEMTEPLDRVYHTAIQFVEAYRAYQQEMQSDEV